jgi:hypothetical protein
VKKWIAKIGGMSPAELSVIIQYGTTTKLWSALSKDPEFIDKLWLQNTAAKIKLTNTLAYEATKQARSIANRPLRAHLPDAVILGVVILVVLSLTFRNRDPVSTANTKTWLPAYHIIDESDVTTRNADPTVRKNLVASIIGRYAKEQLPAGTSVDSTMLSKGAHLSKQLAGMRVFSLRLQPSPILNNVTPPAQLGLFFTSSAKNDILPQQQAIHTVYILDLQNHSRGRCA